MRTMLNILTLCLFSILFSASFIFGELHEFRPNEELTAENLNNNFSKLNRKIDKLEEKLKSIPSFIWCAATVNPKGKIISSFGEGFKIEKIRMGFYKIYFLKNFTYIPTVIASSDGGERGCDVRVRNVKINEFEIIGKEYASNENADTGFSFVVLQKNHFR